MIPKTAMCFALSLLLSGCAASLRQPVTGYLYSEVWGPEQATDMAVAPKRGSACAESILGWVATGDASLATAKRSGHITQVSYVDSYSKSILGVWAKYCVVVYGR